MAAGMATGSITTLAGLPLDTGVEAGAAVAQGTGEIATTQVCLSLLVSGTGMLLYLAHWELPVGHFGSLSFHPTCGLWSRVWGACRPECWGDS